MAISYIRQGSLIVVFALLILAGGILGGARFALPSVHVTEELTIGTASESGTYHFLGEWLADKLIAELEVDPGQVRAQSTAGTMENIDRMSRDELDFAIVQGDAPADPAVTNIGRLYDEYLHIVVNLDNFDEPPRTIADLMDKRVGLGPLKSGTRFAAKTLLEHYGVNYVDAYFDQNIANAKMARRAFDNGQIDALFLLAAVPNDTVAELLQPKRVVLMPVDLPDETLSRLDGFTMSQSAYSHVRIPRGTYNDDPARRLDTIAVTAMLVARADLDPDLVWATAGVLYDPTDRAQLAREVPTTARYNEATVTAPSVFPYHPGMVRYVQDGPLVLEQIERLRLFAYIGAGLTCFVALLVAGIEWSRARRLAAERHYATRQLRKHDVFISYASRSAASKQALTAIIAEFDRLGISHWHARKEMVSGVQWARVIPDAIRESRVAFLMLMSPEADASDHCRRELSIASESGLDLIPYYVEDVKPTGLVEYHLAHLHHIHAHRLPRATALKQLVDDVRRLQDQAPPVPPSDDDVDFELGAAAPRRRRFGLIVALLALVGGLVAGGAAWWWQAMLPPGPLATSPRDGELQVGGATNFRWEYAAHQEGQTEYEVEIRVEDQPRQRFVTHQLMVEPGTALGDGSMEWRVRALPEGASGPRTDWSVTRTYSYYPDTLAKVLATRSITVAVSEDTLLGQDASGKPWNAELELIRRALEDRFGTGIMVRQKLIPWGEGLWGALGEPHIDLMASNISIRDDREETWGVRFTEPLVSYPPAFVLLAGGEICAGKTSSAKSCKIGVRAKTTGEDLAERFRDTFDGIAYFPVELSNVYKVMWERLRSEEYDMLIVDEPYARDMQRLASHRRTQLDIVPITADILDNPPLERIGIGVKPADDGLREILNQGIERHREQIKAYWDAMDRGTLDTP